MGALPLEEAASDNAKVWLVALPGSHWEDHVPLLPKMPVVHPATGVSPCRDLTEARGKKRVGFEHATLMTLDKGAMNQGSQVALRIWKGKKADDPQSLQREDRMLLCIRL